MKNIYMYSISFAGGIVSSFLGVFDTYIKILLILMATDMVSGVLKGAYQKKLNSSIMYKGICKKVAMLLLIGMAYQVDVMLNGEPMFRNVVSLFYIANEGLSIIENVGCFIEYPKFLKDILEKLKTTSDNNEAQ